MGKLADDLKVTVEDNFFAKTTGKKKKMSATDSSRCFFISGLLAGIAEGLLRRSYMHRKKMHCQWSRQVRIPHK
jgi:predicted hydrocarbon binding protein